MQNIFLQEVEVVSKLCSLGTGAVAETVVEGRLLGLAAKCGQMSEQVICSWFGVVRSLTGQKQGSPAVDLGLRLLTNTLQNCAVGILVSRFAEYLEYLLTLLKKFAPGSQNDNLKSTLIATNTILQRTSSSVCAPSSMEKTKFSLVSKIASFVFNQGLTIREQSIISLNLSILLNIITYFPHTLRHQLQQFKPLLLNLAFKEKQFSMKYKFCIVKIIARIPSVQGLKQFADAWNELFYGTMKSLNRLLSVMFLDVREGEFNRLGMVISELLDRNQREVEPIMQISEVDKSGGINIVGRKIFICMHLMEGLLSNSSMEAAVQVPAIAILQLLERCLLMNDLWSEVSQVKQVQVMSILPVIYTTALRLSMVVLGSSGDNAIMHYVTWAKCLKIQLENSNRLDAKQRRQLYLSSSQFLKLAGPGAVGQIYSAVFKCVILEFVLSQEGIQKSDDERPKKKQKLSLVKEVEQQRKEFELSLQFKSEVETKVCVLKLLQTSIDFGATLMDQQTCLMRCALVIKLFQYCWKQYQDDTKYGNDVSVWKKLLEVLMVTMVCEVQREARYRLPYVSVLMFQLKSGISDSDEWYSKFCVESLQSLEKSLHPRSTSVFSTMENCMMVNQNEEVEKQFEAAFAMEDSSQHDQVLETVTEKTQPEKEVQKDNHLQENGGEHQQINISSMQGESPSKHRSNPVNRSNEQGQVFFVQQVAGNHPTTQQEISVDKMFSPDNLDYNPIYQREAGVVIPETQEEHTQEPDNLDYNPIYQHETGVVIPETPPPETQEEHTQEHLENHQEQQQNQQLSLEDNLYQSTEDDQLQQVQQNLSQRSGVGNFGVQREEQQHQSTEYESLDEEEEEEEDDDDELPEIDSGLDDSGDDQDMETGGEQQ